MNLNNTRKSKSTQQGSVLLEALIAVTIFAMGVLGVIGMQAKIIGLSMDARYRTDATFLANQFIAQLWVDPVVDPADPTGLSLAINTASACDPCDAGNANTDIQDWAKQTHGASGVLPPYGDYATCPSTLAITGNRATVTVKWKLPSDSVCHQYVTTTEVQYN